MGKNGKEREGTAGRDYIPSTPSNYRKEVPSCLTGTAMLALSMEVTRIIKNNLQTGEKKWITIMLISWSSKLKNRKTDLINLCKNCDYLFILSFSTLHLNIFIMTWNVLSLYRSIFNSTIYIIINISQTRTLTITL